MRTVADYVREVPGRSRIFEALGIDYCCGGDRPLSDACQENGLDPDTIGKILDAMRPDERDLEAEENPARMSNTDLVDNIVTTHHAYLRTELPRLKDLGEEVSAGHGEREPRLPEVQRTLAAVASGLLDHLDTEEQRLFPAIVDADKKTESRGASVAALIEDLAGEHEATGAALSRIRELTDGFFVPVWGCNKLRAYYDGLRELEKDIHHHVHKENNVLFPRFARNVRQEPTTA